MKIRKIYISGKIGSLDVAAVRPRFQEAEEDVRKMFGADIAVFNPTAPEWQDTLKVGLLDAKWVYTNQDAISYILARDIEELASCDAIYMMIGYSGSPGAMLELAFAEATGKTVIYETIKASAARAIAIHD